MCKIVPKNNQQIKKKGLVLFVLIKKRRENFKKKGLDFFKIGRIPAEAHQSHSQI